MAKKQNVKWVDLVGFAIKKQAGNNFPVSQRFMDLHARSHALRGNAVCDAPASSSISCGATPDQ